jgi:hypothetical protein
VIGLKPLAKSFQGVPHRGRFYVCVGETLAILRATANNVPSDGP